MRERNGSRITAAALAIVLLLLLIPMLALSRYAMPTADDFGYGAGTHAAWESTRSLAAVLRAAAAYTAYIFETWQGSFAAVFLMTLQPGIFGTAYYGLTTWIMLGMLIFGVLVFVRALCRHVLGCTAAERWILTCVLLIACTQFAEGPVEAFYWFNGAVFYTFFFSLFLLLWGLIISFLYRTRGKGSNALYYVAIPLLCALIAGGNYTTGLQLAMLLPLPALVRLFGKKDSNLLLPLSLLLFFALFAVNLSAPGNAARVLQSGGPLQAVRAILNSVAMAARRAGRWTTFPLLTLCAFLVPVGWRFAARTAFSFRWPVLVSVASWLLLASGYTPTYYTQNFWGEYRLLAIQYDLYVLLLCGNVLYWTGWLQKRVFGADGLAEGIGAAVRRRALQLSCGLLAVFLLCAVTNYSMFASTDAVKSLLNGEAKGYQQEVAARLMQLENAEDGADVVVPPLRRQPRLLFLYEWSTDPSAPVNCLVSGYYGVNSVRVDPTMEQP